MELVHWVVPRADGTFAVAFAPAGQDTIPAVGSLASLAEPEHLLGAAGRLRRTPRSLASPLLAHPLALARWEPTATAAAPLRAVPSGAAPCLPDADGALVVVLALGADAGQSSSFGAPSTEIRFGIVFAEYVDCLAQLCAAAGVPVLSIAPGPQLATLELVIGSVAAFPADELSDALTLFRIAAEQCAVARGFTLSEASVRVNGASAPIAAGLHAALAGTPPRKS